jgi:hypothetical protein
MRAVNEPTGDPNEDLLPWTPPRIDTIDVARDTKGGALTRPHEFTGNGLPGYHPS